MHPWIGAGLEDRRLLLEELGLESIDELFASIRSGEGSISSTTRASAKFFFFL